METDKSAEKQYIILRCYNQLKSSTNKGGQVTGVKGERNGAQTVYVADIGYDEYGQRSYIEYGNGVKTSYKYDDARRWLSSIGTTSDTGRTLQNMSYSFDKVGNVRGYNNSSGNYSTRQSYNYDSLYQLVEAKGVTEYKPEWTLDHDDPCSYKSTYEQSWRFDNIGNMKSKYSESSSTPVCKHKSSDLDYSFQYKYASGYAHRTESADNMYYTYDENGSLTSERIDREATLDELRHDVELSDNIYSMDYGIALPNQPGVETAPYSRTYIWNERGLLRSSVENGYVVSYRYGEDGQRAVKSSSAGETMYFNNMWQMSSTAMGMRQTKHIFIGGSRVATKNNWWHDGGTEYEKYNTYWYHADHLGSAQLVTDWRGEEYERIEYTPYGELWVEKVRHGFEGVAYRFTGKEMDSETGLYYYGARYMDPKYSRWLSTDPALGDYIPQAPTDDEAKKHNQSLPGMGGVFNTINCDLYHYAGNNPVKYVDPDGCAPRTLTETQRSSYMNKVKELGGNLSAIPQIYDCTDVTLYVYDKAMQSSTGTSNAYKKMNHDGQPLSQSKYGLIDIQAKDQNPSKGNSNVLFYDGSGNKGEQAFSQSVYDADFNSSNAEIGSVLVLAPNELADGSFTGHTMTVTGFETDSNGMEKSILVQSLNTLNLFMPQFLQQQPFPYKQMAASLPRSQC